MKCQNCGKQVKQVEGRRPRLYCDDRCKMEYHRKRKKKASTPAKKKAAKSKKTKIDLPQKDELILPGPIGQMEFTDGTSAEILQTKSDFQKGTLTITMGPRYPNQYKPLLDLAKSGEINDLSAFREHVKNTKLTGPQRDQIYAQLLRQ